MRARTYLLTALLAFVASVSGSDIVARILVAGSDAHTAVAGHLDWLANSPLAVALLAAPFAGTALICIALGTRSPRAAAILHIVAIAVLAGFCVDTFQAVARGATAFPPGTGEALLVATLFLVIGPMVLATVAIAAAVIAMTGRAHRPERRLSPG